MALKATRVQIWVGGMKDTAGALARKLAGLAEAGAQLEFVLARRAPEKPGKGVVFLAPLQGAKQQAAAKKLKLRKSKSVFAVRVEGADKPGLGARITGALGEAGVNLRGMSAAVIGKRFVLHLALDSAKDASKALRILKTMK